MANVSLRPSAPFRSARAQDWALVVLAVWLFISPWVLQFGAAVGIANGSAPGVAHAAWNAWILGIILFLVAVSAIGRFQISQEWIALVLGVWIFIAPWVLGFARLPRANWDHWIVGVLVLLVALWNLSLLRRTPARPVGTTRPPPMT